LRGGWPGTRSADTLKTVLCNSLLLASSAPEAVRWRLATRRVETTQAHLLLEIVRKNAATAFGREHDFSAIRSVGDYRQRVPIRDYSEMEPYIARAAAGERRVLTADPVESFALSSGSTASSKLIPYTAGLLGDFQRGVGPWLAGLYLEYGSLLSGKSYWQVSPIGVPAGVSAGGIRIGFGADSEYFGRFRGALIRATLAVPEHVAGIAEIEAFRFETLRHLLSCRDLGFISIWNPSFLTLLLADIRRLAPALLECVRSGGAVKRERELRRIFEEWDAAEATRLNRSGLTLFEAIWPRLCVISCWSDAAAREAVARLEPLFPSVKIQPKGLIATEGMMSLPWRSRGAAIALRSHFFEFLEEGGGVPKLAHELDAGHTYSIILTTSGGLYRYRIGDLVDVTGWIGQCPLLRFRGKEGDVVDLVGEKLNGVHVARVAEEVFARYGFSPEFWMIAPERSDAAPFYSLYVLSKSAVPDGLAPALDLALAENFHYAYARRLGQLAPLRLFPIDPQSEPETDYMIARAAAGQRLGAVKRPRCDRNAGWSKVFKSAASIALNENEYLD
jgi:hypothetical protein